MKIAEIVNSATKPQFSFEVLPPLKGNRIDSIYKIVDVLLPYCPKYINITTHRSQIVYKTYDNNNTFVPVAERHRPGTVAVAAALMNKYNLPVVPHILCSGFSRAETEYVLIDLDFLNIHDLLLLRGDKAKHDSVFTPDANGYSHATELQEQINKFNKGFFYDGTPIKQPSIEKFSYGVAGYPEKHDEAPNFNSDLKYLKQKVDAGAEYVITQMFFDNQKFFEFVDKCRANGINVPIIPGIKPITKLKQLSILPKTFHIDIPEALADALSKAKDDDEARVIGEEWCKNQCLDLIAHDVKHIHFYTTMAVQSVAKVVKEVF